MLWQRKHWNSAGQSASAERINKTINFWPLFWFNSYPEHDKFRTIQGFVSLLLLLFSHILRKTELPRAARILPAL